MQQHVGKQSLQISSLRAGLHLASEARYYFAMQSGTCRLQFMVMTLQLLWLKERLEERYELKYGGLMGPDDGDIKDVAILNRLVHFQADATTYEADPRHVEILLAELNLGLAKSVVSPGVARTDDGPGEPLRADNLKRYRSLVMRCNYLATGRTLHTVARNLLGKCRLLRLAVGRR